VHGRQRSAAQQSVTTALPTLLPRADGGMTTHYVIATLMHCSRRSVAGGGSVWPACPIIVCAVHKHLAAAAHQDARVSWRNASCNIQPQPITACLCVRRAGWPEKLLEGTAGRRMHFVFWRSDMSGSAQALMLQTANGTATYRSCWHRGDRCS
jgi:hypothetical protein